ncbi:MAG: DUF1698 domain-containing protein [Bryobacteraceae bacterium]
MATDIDPFAYGKAWKNRYEQTGWWHSFDLPNGECIEGVNTTDGLKKRLSQFPISEDLTGKRVLDIGAWDGWFTFEMERRGADVVAVDCWDNPRFRSMQKLLQSRADYRILDMYELTPDRIGYFDIVLFMGVLYHLKHPLLALERVCALTRDLAVVDSFVLREQDLPGVDLGRVPVMAFYENEEFGGNTDNWVAPSVACLMAFCRTAGFARVELRGVLDYGACVACHRTWSGPPDAPSPAPEMITVLNTNFGINFDSGRDEYVACYFRTAESELRLDEIEPEVAGYGVRPVHVSETTAGVWQANFKLPPGLQAGWHKVRIRLRNSAPSEAADIALDIPIGDAEISICGVRDAVTWSANSLDLSAGRFLCLWLTGLPPNAAVSIIHDDIKGF